MNLPGRVIVGDPTRYFTATVLEVPPRPEPLETTESPTLRALRRVTESLPGGGEQRPGQQAMADAVDEAFAESRHLIVQAGTGTGKSLAYLVPAALLGRPVVIATATKALQEQLAERDLPLVAESLGGVSVAVLKGRSNYLCRQRTAELAERGFQAALEDSDEEAATGPSQERLVAAIERIMAWEGSSSTGDRSELGEEVSERAWSMVSTGPRECPGAFQCPQGNRCFAEQARANAAQADLVVVNLHLLGAHLASGGMLLPEHDAVIIDEVHELEGVMTQSLGVDLSPGRVRSLGSLARSVLKGGELERAFELVQLADSLGSELSAFDDAARVDLAEQLSLAVILRQLDEGIRQVLNALRALQENADARVARALSAATRLLEEISKLRSPGEDDVLWVSGLRSARSLVLSPIDVGPRLASGLFERATVVMTSATVPPRLAARLGLDSSSVDELDVGSPFDFATQSLLYVAEGLGDRRSSDAEERIADELSLLIDAAGGRTLALFTSRRAMGHVADLVADRIEHPILVQGAATNRALIERFRDEEDACLFATMGLWQGLDVPGRSLSLVAIDRLPFGRPDDPLLEARRSRAGSQAFSLIDLPRAATLLAQGVGRLIRSSNDRGVVAVLDDRLATASYRSTLLAALPPMKRTRSRDEVLAFLRSITNPELGG
jgi:ATP-dependent DNA helicase DinG